MNLIGCNCVFHGNCTLQKNLFPQIPGLFDHVKAFEKCENGVGYALLLAVPTLYLLSAVLFGLLGVVILRWNRKEETKTSSYSSFTNDDQSESEEESTLHNANNS